MWPEILNSNKKGGPSFGIIAEIRSRLGKTDDFEQICQKNKITSPLPHLAPVCFDIPEQVLHFAQFLLT